MDTQEIFGVRAIIECIEANQNLEKVFLLKDQRSPLFKQLENLLREKKSSTQLCTHRTSRSFFK